MTEPALMLKKGILCNCPPFLGKCSMYVYRCDGQSDCLDASDEANCEIAVVPHFYLKGKPPPPMGNETLADILLSIEVLEILDLNEVQSTMKLKYTMIVEWYDSRLKFKNLKMKPSLNTLENEEALGLWYPAIVFFNTEETDVTKVN